MVGSLLLQGRKRGSAHYLLLSYPSSRALISGGVIG